MTFTETQKFSPVIIWLMRAMLAVVIGALILAFKTTAMPTLFYVVIILSVLPLLLIEFSKLTTQVDGSGIDIRFKPFAKKHFNWADINSAEVIDYGFVGGWGVRMFTKYGTVYNTRGREGLWLKLKNGKQVVIGTQKRTDMESVVEALMSNNNSQVKN